MGVHGLWKLLRATGKPVTFESLEGQVLAVDISIWLHQAVRGMRDAEGNLVANAHLVTLLHRICKLLFYRIKPIFIFDGSAPAIKRQTMAGRRRRKEFALDKSGKATEQMLKNYLKVQAVDTVLGKKKGAKKPQLSQGKADIASDMYFLPPLPGTTEAALQREEEEEEEDDTWEVHKEQRSFLADHYHDLGSIDIHSEDFKNLPPEMQHELIEEFQERNKHNTWSKKIPLPEEANEFSDFQLAKLLNKNKLNRRLDDIREEMSRRNSGEIAAILDMETKSIESRRVVSEDTQHYILVKTQKETKNKVNDEWQPSGSNVAMDTETIKEITKPCWQDDIIDVTENKEGKGSLTADDLERAIQIVFNAQKVKMSKKRLMGCALNVAMETNACNFEMETIPKIDLTVQKEKTKKINNTGNMLTVEVKGQGDVEDQTLSSERNNSPESIKHSHSDLIEETCETQMDKKQRDLETDSTKHSEFNPDVEGSNENIPVSTVVSPNYTSPVITKVISKEQECVKEIENLPLNESKDFSKDSESESEDDFIEVSFNPSLARGDDELFPAELFLQSDHVSQDLITPDVYDVMETTNNIIKSPDEVHQQQLAEEKEMEARSKERERSIEEWKELNMNSVNELENDLEHERVTLQTESQRQQRIGASITDQMYAESKELLKLFGIPYVESPQEAEAQCAFFDISNLTQGSITDDSDVWLFGGKRVYKNFFNKDRDVEFYDSSDFEKHLFLDRMKLINLALLLGCDYADGIEGVGYVTAMEIMSEFPGDHIDGLKAFRAWWDNNVGNLNPPVETKIKSQLRKLQLPSTFPQEAVVNAFMDPQVDQSNEVFTWGSPDLDSIRGFALERLSWSIKKTDENLLPVLKRMNQKSIQRPITTYFLKEVDEEKKIKSKRLQSVLRKFHKIPKSIEDSKVSNGRETGKLQGKLQRKGKRASEARVPKKSKGRLKVDNEYNVRITPGDIRKKKKVPTATLR